MPRIGINSNDLTLLAKDIDDINTKITNLKGTLNSKFDSVKELKLYDNGFNNINDFLEKELSTLTDIKSKIEKYQNDVMGVEKSFGEQFNNIKIPSITGSASTLAVVNPTVFATPQVNTVPNTNYVSNSNVTNSNVVNSNVTTQDKEVVADKKEEVIENTTVDRKPVENKVVEAPKVVEQKETSENGSNLFGVLAGTAGVLGAGGLAAAAYVNSKNKKEDEDDDEEPIEQLEDTPSDDLINNLIKEY